MVNSSQHVQSNHPPIVITFYLPIASHQRYFHSVLFAQPFARLVGVRIQRGPEWLPKSCELKQHCADEWRVFPPHSSKHAVCLRDFHEKKWAYLRKWKRSTEFINTATTTEQSNNNLPINLLADCVGSMTLQPNSRQAFERWKPLLKNYITNWIASWLRNWTTLCLQFLPRKIKWAFTATKR